ncbi:hypothetical protein [Reyranella sp.]|uniref:hypothetical protein n=1 Tax=Reyranella sp. TaxID=1929291 RepID=UPI003BA95FDA
MTAPLSPPPWTATSVLQRSYQMARDNFPAFVTVTLIFAAVTAVVDVLSLGLLGGLVHLLAGVATAICLTWATLQALAGNRPDWEPILRQLQGPLFGRLLLLGVIQYLVIALSTILVIPPFFLLPLWAVTVPAMMVERLDIGGAFSRSADLTRGRRLPILGAFLLWFVFFLVGGWLILALFGHGALARLLLAVYGAVAAIVVQPLPAIFYVLLREEKEGMTAGQITAALD